MRIHFRSDIHLEVNSGRPMPPYPTECDVIVIAGDIEDCEHPMDVARKNPDKNVIVVLGNHDYWYPDNIEVDAAIASYRNPELKNLHVLENETTVIEGQLFVGATLWGEGPRNWYEHKEMLRGLNDYQFMANWSPNKMVERNRASRAFITSTISKNPGCIVVTHFPPMLEVRRNKRSNDLLNEIYYQAGMVKELQNLCREGTEAKAWIFGHSHEHLDITFGGTRYLTNCRAYAKTERSGFDPNWVVDL